jgi:hypothetical protein
MATRRVFRTRVKCPGIDTDLGPTAKQRAMIGQIVTLEKGSNSEVNLVVDGAVVGCLDTTVGHKVASAIEGGRVFTAVIERAFPNYIDTGRACGTGQFKQNGAILDIKVEYHLEKGQPGIETERCWRCVDGLQDPNPQTARSFFTKVAGVTFKGRQRVVSRCSVGERLVLVRDPTNRFDKGAIKVMRLNGEQLGFLPAHVSRGGDSSGLAFQMDRGDEFQCRISDLTGGWGRKLGVNIEITEGEDFETRGTSELSNVAPGAPAQHDVVPVDNHLMRWLAAAALLVLVFIITRNC